MTMSRFILEARNLVKKYGEFAAEWRWQEHDHLYAHLPVSTHQR
jgi:hypothetical protein